MRREFPNIKFQGRGTEDKYASAVVSAYAQWSANVFYGLHHSDLLFRLETLGRREQVSGMLKVLRQTEREEFMTKVHGKAYADSFMKEDAKAHEEKELQKAEAKAPKAVVVADRFAGMSKARKEQILAIEEEEKAEKAEEANKSKRKAATLEAQDDGKEQEKEAAPMPTPARRSARRAASDDDEPGGGGGTTLDDDSDAEFDFDESSGGGGGGTKQQQQQQQPPPPSEPEPEGQMRVAFAADNDNHDTETQPETQLLRADTYAESQQTQNTNTQHSEAAESFPETQSIGMLGGFEESSSSDSSNVQGEGDDMESA